MKIKKIIFILMHVFVLTLLITNGVNAEDVTVIGSIPYSITQKGINSKNNELSSNEKTIQLLHIQLSEEAKSLLKKQAHYALARTHQFAKQSLHSEFPEKVQVGMNNVPVLDQGKHGTCVTFAVTGALDAVIGKGDYISQLCNLQLGNYLEKYRFGTSGWNGSYASQVISQIEAYGIINQEKQKSAGCGGLMEYPTNTKDTPDSFIYPDQYYSMNEMVFGKTANWSNIYWRISSNWTFDEVKKALISGDRVVLTVLLPRVDLGLAGAVGHYKTAKDTWILTKDVLDGVNNYELEAGHAMVITGYDDNAIAVDSNDQTHQGLLTLRNSWGSKAGDKGEFYMSYDYFKLLTFAAERFSAN